MWLSPAGFEFWEKMMKDEAKKYLKEYSETGEFDIHTPGKADSEESKGSIQED